jgi:hypothetical protein
VGERRKAPGVNCNIAYLTSDGKKAAKTALNELAQNPILGKERRTPEKESL